MQHPHQSAAGHTGNQLGSLATQDESSQIKEHAHHRQQDKHIDLEMEAWGGGGGGGAVGGDDAGEGGKGGDKDRTVSGSWNAAQVQRRQRWNGRR